jgi:hypothetical protein
VAQDRVSNGAALLPAPLFRSSASVRRSMHEAGDRSDAQLYLFDGDATRTASYRLAVSDPLRSTGEERYGADHLDLDVGQFGRKPLLESALVVLEVREDSLPVVKAD